MAQLYEYAVIHTPKKGMDDEGKSVLVVPVTTILANSVAEVNIVASRQIPETLLDVLDEVDIVARPF